MGEGRGGEGGGPGRSGRVESGRAVVQRDEARGTHDNGEQRTDRAKSWPNPDLYVLHSPTPSSSRRWKNFQGFLQPPPLHVSPDAKDKNKKYSRGDNAVRFPDVYKK